LKRLAILGASGHGRVVADAAAVAGWNEIVFYDDAWPECASNGPWSVAGTFEAVLKSRPSFDGAVVAIGNNRSRLSVQRELQASKFGLVTITHPRATVSERACVGLGSVILAGSVINAFATLGTGCIVNTGASVDHDCVLGDGVHLSPGARLGGTVSVGEATWIGIGAVVKEGISIGSNVIVGAGAAVIDDVPDGLTVVGVPARPLERKPK
jgi:sugar O-acyltransferase (sialic acid O-acetyltransferase NeuD family)